MYIILHKENNKSAVIRDVTELAGYLNIVTSTLRRQLKKSNGLENDKFKIILPDYVQIKSNRGGKRYPKEQFE